MLTVRFAHLGEVLLWPTSFARSGEVLFFAPPKKSTQKKGDPGGLPAARVPCASRKARRSRNSLRSNRRELAPAFPAMLGCARRVENQTNTQGLPTATRLHSPSTAATPGTRRAPCLRQVYLPSCARPRRGEERRASAQPMSAPGALLFGYFLLGKQEKVPRPSGRNRQLKDLA